MTRGKAKAVVVLPTQCSSLSGGGRGRARMQKAGYFYRDLESPALNTARGVRAPAAQGTPACTPGSRSGAKGNKGGSSSRITSSLCGARGVQRCILEALGQLLRRSAGRRYQHIVEYREMSRSLLNLRTE